MDKQSFILCLLISAAIHICITFLVISQGGVESVKDHTFKVEITPLPPEAKPKKKDAPKKTPKKPKTTRRLSKRQRELKLSHIRPKVFKKENKYQIPPSQKREDTILLNTRNPKYISYSSRIKSKIELAWEYPPEARREEIRGGLTLMFSILKSGNLDDLRLLQSSGFRVLDVGAMNAVRSAAPYYPIPQRMGIDKLNIIATFEYRVDYSP